MTPSAPAKVAKPMPEPAFYTEAAEQIMQKHGPRNVSAYEELLKSGLFVDACRWVAVHLPVRHAIWWGLICVLDTKDGSANDILTAQLTSWVIDPTEPLQTQLLNQTWLDTPESPLDYLAKAVSWTGPSMLPIHLPTTAPNPEHVGQMIAAAVDLAATAHGILEPAEAYLRFLDFANKVDNGTLHWENQAGTAAKSQTISKPQGLFPSL